MSNHIVIIGGTACGPKAAARARRCDPKARITLIEQESNLSTATCGLPYFISGVIRDRSVMVAREPDYFRSVFDMEVLINTRATSIDPATHKVDVLDLESKQPSTIDYDKLVLATGNHPIVPNWPGKDLEGICTLSTLPDADAIMKYLSGGKKDVVVVGAGLIGLEMAEAFIHLGLNVTVVEAMSYPLPTLLDFEVAARVEKQLRLKGVKLLFDSPVTGFTGDAHGKVRTVSTKNQEIEAGLVLLSLGVRPETGLAREAGLTIGETGGIDVDSHMRTNNPDIYAGGDCVEVVNLVTGRPMLAPMGSTANKHGRTIGTNVTGGNETFPGVLGTAVVKVFDINVGRTGLNEAQSQQAGYDTITALVPGTEHASYYPGGGDVIVKLIAGKSGGRILGGQAVGTGDTAKRIDVLATAISLGCKVDDLANLDLAYAPPYNSAMDPLHNAANVIRNKRDGIAKSLTIQQVKDKIDRNEKFTFLDVRSMLEWSGQHINAEQAKLVPLPELRERLDEIPKDQEIVTFCHSSIRAYQAQRILAGAGFKDVKFMDGSLAAWPYETS